MQFLSADASLNAFCCSLSSEINLVAIAIKSIIALTYIKKTIKINYCFQKQNNYLEY